MALSYSVRVDTFARQHCAMATDRLRPSSVDDVAPPPAGKGVSLCFVLISAGSFTDHTIRTGREENVRPIKIGQIDIIEEDRSVLTHVRSRA